MAIPNLPGTLLKLGLALAKYHIKNVIGDEALNVVADTVIDVGGEKVQAKIDSIFASNEGQKELLKAAKAADEEFKKECKDNDLRQLFTMDYGSLLSVQEAIRKLPEALDDKTLRETLFVAFRNDTPRRISDEKIKEGVDLYIKCLQNALLPVENFGLRIINNVLQEIEKNVKDIKADVKTILEQGKTNHQSNRQIINFNTLIEEKIKGFVGRQFIIRELDSFLATEKSGYFIIRGEPGIGKSAFMAKLIKDRGYIHHFNIASQNICSTSTFLENICAQLIARYELPFEDLPHDIAVDGSFLMKCLGEAAANPKNHPVVVAIDSLDEADRLGLASAVNILYLPSYLPQGVYIVVTTRPLHDLHLQVMQQRILDIDANSEGNLSDIDTYIVNYIVREAMQAQLSAWDIKDDQFIIALRKKSQGNFMYLYYVLPAIERGDFIKGTLSELPDGLIAYYQRHWRQMQNGNEIKFEAVYKLVIGVLAVVREPVTIKQIATWTKLNQDQVKDAIKLWREFLYQSKDEQSYVIYHASFQDFLREQV